MVKPATNTPRKKRQRKVIEAKNKKITRLNKKLSKVIQNKKTQESALDDALKKLPPHLAGFVKLQFDLHAAKKHGRRYSPEMKSLAISLFHASGKAYRLLSKLFILPTRSSLRNYISKMPTEAGISQATINTLKQKVSQMSDMEKLCSLCMDEISLKTHLFYSIPKDKIVGLEDFGGGYRTNKVATSALVLLARSISGKWKQPIGYVLVNGACPTDILEDVMKEALDKLQQIGLNVVVVMSDMGSNFHSFANRMGVTRDKPWFTHNNKTYFLMFDPPHLLKCVRNNLMKYTFKFDGYVAVWNDVENFYQKDISLTIRAAPKLTEKHIHPNNFAKMRVKYATQVLSHTVAAAICTYVSVGGLPSSAMGTAELLSRFDSIFDCFNSSTLHTTKKLRCAVNEKTSHIEYLKESITFIKNLKVFQGDKDVTGRIKCLHGWLVTINALILIWSKLKSNHQFKFLFTRRLNTDPLENFFGTIRQQGGNSDNPTPVQFTRAFRKLFFSSLLTSSAGNCAADFDVMLAEYTNASKKAKKKSKNKTTEPSETSQPQTLAIGPTDYREPEVSTNIIQDNAIAYVAGYLLKKSFKIHKCQKCQDVLLSNQLDDNRNLLCFFKSFEDNKTPFGGLNAPSPCYLEYVIKLEDVFSDQFSVYTKCPGVGANILKKIKAIPITFQCCPEFSLEYLQKLFIRMRIYYSIKFANRDLATSKPKDRKYIKVTHL